MTPLRQRMLDALVLRGMAQRTQQAYIQAVGKRGLEAPLDRGTVTWTTAGRLHHC